MVRIFEGAQPVLAEAANAPEQESGAPMRAAALPPAPPSRAPFLFAALLSLFWIGAWGAYLWGWLGPQGLLALGLAQAVLFGGAMLLPPFLFIAMAFALSRALAMGRDAARLRDAAEALFAIDDSAAAQASRLGRAVRHELDALNAGLDGAFARLRSLESALQNQVAALDEAGARIEVRGEALASRLHDERGRIEDLSGEMAGVATRAGDALGLRVGEEGKRIEIFSRRLTEAAALAGTAISARLAEEQARIEGLSEHLAGAAVRAGETLAGRVAGLKAGIESAEGTLKMAAQALDVQAAGFRAAAQAAAEAPHQAALMLDGHARKIQEVSDAALARAEFLLARHEKHRAQMEGMLARLNEDGARIDAMLAAQCTGLEQAITTLSGESGRFAALTGEAERNLELVMSNAGHRAGQLGDAFAREAERLKETSEAANAVLTALVGTLREAGQGAQTLVGESAAQARQDAQSLVGAAMAECERLLRAAGEMTAKAEGVRATLAKAVEDVESHMVRLPTLAQGEAQRVRQMVQGETEQILDLSARTLATLHARLPLARAAQPAPDAEPETEKLKGLARKITQRPRRDLRQENEKPAAKGWEMKTLLAAADGGTPGLGAGSAAALGALELALADMAVDLHAIDSDAPPDNQDWKRYLAGDRAVFARRLANAIDETAVDRITRLYRDDRRFHDAADAYLAEFEGLLARAREGDGGGILASTILTADTGKIYLAIAYALGRL